MSAKSKPFSVTILGREFKLACAPEEERALLESVAYLNRCIDEVRASGKVTSPERMAVLAALNIAHDSRAFRAAGNFDMEQAKRRIESMIVSVDQALKKPDRLF